MSSTFADDDYNRLTPLEQYMSKERYDKRILSIQSHVVSGFAGNKCAVFPLQLHGFEVDTINSVQFSHHTQYPGAIHGQRLNERDLADLFDGLRHIDLHKKYSHILTGYCGDASFLRQIASIIRECRKQKPELIYVCDPVMGDHGKYYPSYPRELCQIYRDELLPLANVITPNAFELSELSGIAVNTEADCLRAITHIHKTHHIRIVVMTSGLPAAPDETNPLKSMYCYASECIEAASEDVKHDGADQKSVQLMRQFRFEIPLIKGTFVGTGDLFTALLLIWLDETGGQLCQAVRATISSMQGVLKRTSGFAFAQSQAPSLNQRELRLVQSRLDILKPMTEQIEFIELNPKS